MKKFSTAIAIVRAREWEKSELVNCWLKPASVCLCTVVVVVSHFAMIHSSKNNVHISQMCATVILVPNKPKNYVRPMFFSLWLLIVFSNCIQNSRFCMPFVCGLVDASQNEIMRSNAFCAAFMKIKQLLARQLCFTFVLLLVKVITFRQNAYENASIFLSEAASRVRMTQRASVRRRETKICEKMKKNDSRKRKYSPNQCVFNDANLK